MRKMMKSMQKEIDKRFMKAYLPLLAGMGMTDLTMNPSALLGAKKVIRGMAFENWKSVARTACDLASPEEINRLIDHENKRL
jgi:phosphoenolpyruvate-protein kinase (PTS system EI component)